NFVPRASVCVSVIFPILIGGDDLQYKMLSGHNGLISMFSGMQVVQIEGVFRMVVAPNIAFRAINARSLQRTVSISSLLANGERGLKIVAKKYINVHQFGIPAVFFCHVGEK